jgi:hypothetical protein
MSVEFRTFDLRTRTYSEPWESDFGYREGVGISFCFPIKTASGRVLVPAYKFETDAAGRVRHYRDFGMPVEQALTLVGEYRPDGSLAWHAGTPRSITRPSAIT